MALLAGDGDEGAVGIEVPQQFAVRRPVGSEVAVEGACEDHAGHGGDGCGKTRIASRTIFVRAAIRRRGVPQDFAVGRVEGEQPRLRLALFQAGEHRVRVGGVDAPLAGRHAPMHAAGKAAAPDARRPQALAASVRIQGEHVAGLLSCHQDFLAVVEPHQHGRGADVEVGAVLLGAVLAAADEASHVPGIPRQGLVGPGQAA